MKKRIIRAFKSLWENIGQIDRKIRASSIRKLSGFRKMNISRQTLGKIGYFGSLAVLLVILGIASHTYQNRDAGTIEMTAEPSPLTVASVITPKPTAEPTPEPEAKRYVWPVSGEILNGFSEDKLVWSETLAQWQTHPAIDIAASPGEVVAACGDGIIADAYSDPLWGNTIIIEHEGGMTSVYSNLSTLNLVEAGKRISCGETISAVGESALTEGEMPVHLHFCFTQNGEPVDFAAMMNEKEF